MESPCPLQEWPKIESLSQALVSERLLPNSIVITVIIILCSSFYLKSQLQVTVVSFAKIILTFCCDDVDDVQSRALLFLNKS